MSTVLPGVSAAAAPDPVARVEAQPTERSEGAAGVARVAAKRPTERSEGAAGVARVAAKRPKPGAPRCRIGTGPGLRPDGLTRATGWLAPALLCLALPGCLLSRQSSPITVLAPSVQVAADPAWPAVDWSLQVYRPRADAMRDSARLLVRPAPSQLQVYKGAAWLTSAPDLVHSVLLHAFEDSGRIGAVVPAGAIRGRYALHSELRRFEAVDDGSGRLRVEVDLQVKLVLVRTAQVLASTSFSQRLEADGKGLPALTRAFEQVLTALSVEVVGWTLAQGQAAEIAAAVEAPPATR